MYIHAQQFSSRRHLISFTDYSLYFEGSLLLTRKDNDFCPTRTPHHPTTVLLDQRSWRHVQPTPAGCLRLKRSAHVRKRSLDVHLSSQGRLPALSQRRERGHGAKKSALQWMAKLRPDQQLRYVCCTCWSLR